MEALVAFWSHALAAALFAALVLWELRRGIRIGGEQRMLLAAFALTACWAWLTAVEPMSMLAAYAETARNLVWVGVLYRLADGDGGERASAASSRSMPRSPACSGCRWWSTPCRW